MCDETSIWCNNFVEITLLVSDYLFFCRFNSFLSSYRLFYCSIVVLSQELIVFFSAGCNFIVRPWAHYDESAALFEAI